MVRRAALLRGFNGSFKESIRDGFLQIVVPPVIIFDRHPLPVLLDFVSLWHQDNRMIGERKSAQGFLFSVTIHANHAIATIGLKDPFALFETVHYRRSCRLF